MLASLLPALLLSTPMPVVELHFHERPPYYQSTASGPTGLVMTPLRRALQTAELPHRLVSTPALRQLQLIEQTDTLACGVGWFRNEQREAKGLFSKAIYQDRPLAMVVREPLGWALPRAMAEALGDPHARLLVKAGYSYGPQFDQLLKAREGPTQAVTGEVSSMLRMLVRDRADWTPMAPEEAEHELPALTGLRLLAFADAPAGNRRHLYCNKAVPAEWLLRLDAALPTLNEQRR